ncbi:hypothetical protein [Leifsonia sp. NPDC080035]|uniref:Uncharacterized protein n=1 Tax=Leifsonia sp. NPDC080035 TaxID=3143936 RepID=A0AAU7GFC4_9MICO
MSIVADTQDDQLLTWSSPAEQLWVASTPTSYLGMVESTGDMFIATGPHSEALGSFGSLNAARLAVYRAQ